MSKWEMVRLGDVCTFINGDRGKNYPSATDFVNTGIAFINAGHLENKRVSFGNMNYITEQKFNLLGSGKIQIGDVLYCLRGSLGKHGMILEDIKGAIASSLVILRPHSIFPNYLMYCLDSSLILKQQNKVNTGSSQPNLSASSVKGYKVPLPPIDIQKQIATILDSATAMINLRKQRLAELDNLIKSMFYDMFGDPVTNPLEWRARKLGDIGKVGSSRRVFTSEFVESGIPFFRGTEIALLSFGEYTAPKYFISIPHYEALKEAMGVPEIGDLLLPSICSNGEVWRVDSDAPFYFKDGRVLWIHLEDKSVDSEYICFALREKLIRDYWKFASGTTFAEMKIVILKDIALLLPPLSLQTQFATIAEKIQKQKLEVKKSIEESQLLFDSLMSQYFE